MPRSPLALAALASVAVPGLDVYDVLRSPHADSDFDVVVVKDATGTRWASPSTTNIGHMRSFADNWCSAIRRRDQGLFRFRRMRIAGKPPESESAEAPVSTADAAGRVREDMRAILIVAMGF